MGGYLGHFVVYTIAMVGIIYAALLVYKKFSTGCGFGAKSDFLKVEDSISLSPRKNLYVIKAGNEKFLIASDIDRTSLIAKLGAAEAAAVEETSEIKQEDVLKFVNKLWYNVFIKKNRGIKCEKKI